MPEGDDGSGEELEPEFTPKPDQKPPALDRFENVLVVMSGKGGVGKSTVAVNLALALDELGLDTGIADFDITNPNTPRMTGLEDVKFTDSGPFEPPEIAGVPVASAAFFKPDGKALAWRGPLKQKMIDNLLSRVDWPDLDVLVLDLPPGTSDEPLSVSEIVPTEMLSSVLVTTPQVVSTEDVALNFRFAVTVEMPVVGIVENMAPFECECGREHAIFGEGGGEQLSQMLGVPLLAQIPTDPDLRARADVGKPIVLADPEADSAQAIRGAAKQLAPRFE